MLHRRSNGEGEVREGEGDSVGVVIGTRDIATEALTRSGEAGNTWGGHNLRKT